MGRKKISVRKLAQMANIATDDAQLMLLEGGIAVSSKDTIIPKSKYKKAIRILKITDRLKSDPLKTSTPAKKDGQNTSTKLISPVKAEPEKKEKKKGRLKRTSKKNPSPIGPYLEEPLYLNISDVESIHNALVKDFRTTKDPIEPPGIRDANLLASALSRPKTSLGNRNKYPSAAMAGAALLHALVHNHPFHNGNKRTGIVSLIIFLDKNGWVLQVNQDALYECVLALAAHKLKHPKNMTLLRQPDEELFHIAQWIQRNMKKISSRDNPLKFRELKSILNSYGCDFSNTGQGNKVKITRGQLTTVMTSFGEGREVHSDSIHRTRKNLHLDEEHGYDSDIFYNADKRIPDFINKYRKLLDRLAKV